MLLNKDGWQGVCAGPGPCGTLQGSLCLTEVGTKAAGPLDGISEEASPCLCSLSST